MSAVVAGIQLLLDKQIAQ